MSRNKKWIVAAIILIVAGALICAVSIGVFKTDLGKLGTVSYVTNTYEVSENFHNIEIKGDTGKISFALSEDGSCKVVCHEEEDNPHQVYVQSDTLTIKEEENTGWKFFNFGINIGSPEITVYLPESSYGAISIVADTGDVEIPSDFTFDSIKMTLDTGNAKCFASTDGDIYIKTDTGHINVSGISAAGMKLVSDTGMVEASDVVLANDLDIRVETGKVILTNVSCRNLTSNGDTGSIDMTNVIASCEFNLERDTGSIKFDGCDADTIYVKTDTGSVTGTLLSDKVFITETDTGSINVPKTITGGRCEISTDTGNINIEIQ